jgi:hypothetical protein
MLIYASSCADYFSVHGEAFTKSALQHGHEVRIDMADNFPDWRKKLRFTQERVFNCFLRFLRLPEMLDDDDVLVMDIDSIINKPIEFKDCDMALFFRPWLNHVERLQVLLTASYWSKKSKPFAEAVRDKILASPHNEWCDDQMIVSRLCREIGHKFKIQNLNEDFVCYHFDREAPIWTCKGPARKNNPVYLERRAAYAY